MHRRRGVVVRRLHTQAFTQGIAQRDRAPMFLEQITEGFLGEILQPLAGLKAELIESVPGLGIEFDAASDCLLLHGAAISSGIAAKTQTIDGSATKPQPLAALRLGFASGWAFLAGPALAGCSALADSMQSGIW